MGSGKTHWGKIWAEKYRFEFIDLDAAIERREQRTIVEIFEQSGEDIFRLLETKMLREMNRHENTIIACGGGTPCFHDNMQWMNEKGTTVYLDAPAGYLFGNIVKEKDQRPLVKTVNEAELLFFTEQKLKSRLPFYQRATFIMDAPTIEETSFEKILATLPRTDNL